MHVLSVNIVPWYFHISREASQYMKGSLQVPLSRPGFPTCSHGTSSIWPRIEQCQHHVRKDRSIIMTGWSKGDWLLRNENKQILSSLSNSKTC